MHRHHRYPGMLHWWMARERARAAQGYAGACHGVAEEVAREDFFEAGRDEGGAFGVRRPLRYLAYKLDLREEQTNELARILAELKTERAQAEVDERRTL